MRPTIEPDFDPPFVVDEPERHIAPFVFNAPHAGNVYPSGFLTTSRLDALALRRSEDAFVDSLFAGVVSLGAPLMTARFPRAYLDLNREPYELDPRMFENRLPPFVNTRSMRVAGGLGTIRASWPTGTKSTASDSRSRRGCGASNGSTSPIIAPCASSSIAPPGCLGTRC
jgi:N-formylglutamate amidohydrolase